MSPHVAFLHFPPTLQTPFMHFTVEWHERPARAHLPSRCQKASEIAPILSQPQGRAVTASLNPRRSNSSTSKPSIQRKKTALVFTVTDQSKIHIRAKTSRGSHSLTSAPSWLSLLIGQRLRLRPFPFHLSGFEPHLPDSTQKSFRHRSARYEPLRKWH